MKQMARNLLDIDDGFLRGKRYLILGRDPLYRRRQMRTVGCSGGNGSVACSTSTTAMRPDRGSIVFWDTTAASPSAQA